MPNNKQNYPKLTFVDIETTGFDSTNDRIIEVGVLEIYNNNEITRYNQLVNPGTIISKEITRITGIRNKDIESAPRFEDIKEELYKLLNGSLFVAHNAAFDYGFIESEFLRYDIPFARPQLCTVKLSRELYPQYKTHNLDSISKRHKIEIENRHRAFDDALALWLFYQKVNVEFSEDYINWTIQKLIKEPTQTISTISNSQTGLFS